MKKTIFFALLSGLLLQNCQHPSINLTGQELNTATSSEVVCPELETLGQNIRDGEDTAELVDSYRGNPMYTREGHQVHCLAQGDKWLAQVQENCTPGFSRELILPIYGKTTPWGDSVEDAIPHVVSYSPEEQANWVHVVLPEKAAMKQGFVYIGRKAGLYGGHPQAEEQLSFIERLCRTNAPGQSFGSNLRSALLSTTLGFLGCAAMAWSTTEGETFNKSVQSIAGLCTAAFAAQCIGIDSLRPVFANALLRGAQCCLICTTVAWIFLDGENLAQSIHQILLLSAAASAVYIWHAYMQAS
ncbi:MAG: hypothetical protein AAFU83_02540 [Bacteroidota bacterium]